MRALILTSLATLLSVAPMAQPLHHLEMEHAGLSVEIPEGYALNATCEIPADFVMEEGESIGCDDLPAGASDQLQTALYTFVDERRYRFLSISLRSDLTEEGRSEWIRGTRALAGLGGTFTPTDPLEWTDGDAAAATWTEGAGAGIVLYGCEGWRCYRFFASGPATDLEDDPAHYRAVLAGITARPLAAPVATPWNQATTGRQGD